MQRRYAAKLKVGRSHTRLALASVVVAGLLIAAASGPGYLTTEVDISTVVPPPPQKGDPRYEADRRVFRATRRLLSTPRGELAKADVPWKVPDLMRDFSCAVGIALSPERTPATYRLLANANADTARANDLAKNKWKRSRPFLIDNGPICENKADLAKTYDYPSGHTTRGWTAGLVLAELRPDRADQILTRARAYGESRIVCGAHNMSAVEAGRLGATVSMQRVRLSGRYVADLAAAKAELQSLASNAAAAPTRAACSVEETLITPSIYAQLSRPTARRGGSSQFR